MNKLTTLSASLLFLICMSCGESDGVQEITESEWDEISDTLNRKGSVSISYEKSKGDVGIDWSEAFRILNSEDSLLSNPLIRKQEKVHDTPEKFTRVMQESTHEPDTVALSAIVKSLVGRIPLSPENARATASIITDKYKKGEFYGSNYLSGGAMLKIQEGGRQFYLNFTYHVAFVGVSGTLSKGKISVPGATMNGKVEIGNLAYICELEYFLITEKDKPEPNRARLNHQKFPDQNVYYLKEAEAGVANKIRIGNTFRNRKALFISL